MIKLVLRKKLQWGFELDFLTASSNFFVSDAKNLSSLERVQELDWGDQTQNVSESVAIGVATFIGSFYPINRSNQAIRFLWELEFSTRLNRVIYLE